MPRKKAKRCLKVSDPETDEKLQLIDDLLKSFQQQTESYADHLNSVCEETCVAINKAYMDKLQSIPDHIRKMTVSKIMELQEKENKNASNTPEAKSIRSVFERNRQATDKKKTLKKDKKRSLSASSSVRHLGIGRAHEPTALRLSRTLSDSSMFTPMGKHARLPSMAITPKFNPKLPVPKMARKPKGDEIVMSMSGSPIQCYGNEVSLSLGGGTVLTFNEGQILEKDFLKKIDEPLQKTLENVKNQLVQIFEL